MLEYITGVVLIVGVMGVIAFIGLKTETRKRSHKSSWMRHREVCDPIRSE